VNTTITIKMLRFSCLTEEDTFVCISLSGYHSTCDLERVSRHDKPKNEGLYLSLKFPNKKRGGCIGLLIFQNEKQESCTVFYGDKLISCLFNNFSFNILFFPFVLLFFLRKLYCSFRFQNKDYFPFYWHICSILKT
jgi:hypothetical protein